MDPCILYAEKSVIKKETEKMLQAFGPQGHIANLGHGVYPDVPFQNVQYFIETIQNYQHR
jgi:uroporphyrinogen decarboxylase